MLLKEEECWGLLIRFSSVEIGDDKNEIDGDNCGKSLLEVALREKEHLEVAKIGKYD